MVRESDVQLLHQAGIAWVHELFQESGSRDFAALRFAYSADWTRVKPLKLYHNLEHH